VKIVALLVFLVVVAITPARSGSAGLGYLILLAVAESTARLSPPAARRALAVILPFSLTLAVAIWLSGDPGRAIEVVFKSLFSAWAVSLVIATTPLPELLRGLEGLGVPRFLLMVAQFLYRYLFVITEQGHRMRLGALCRGGFRRRHGFRAAAGALGVLFARSHERAEKIHRAMLARGYPGRFRLLTESRIGGADIAFLAIAVAGSVGASLASRL
jgi:cobalt/nickel transport system permease protein